jgi:hypothetical protein
MRLIRHVAEPASHQLINDRKQKQNVQSNDPNARVNTNATNRRETLRKWPLMHINKMSVSRGNPRAFATKTAKYRPYIAYNALIIQPSPPARHEGVGGIDTLSGEPGPSPADSDSMSQNYRRVESKLRQVGSVRTLGRPPKLDGDHMVGVGDALPPWLFDLSRR